MFVATVSSRTDIGKDCLGWEGPSYESVLAMSCLSSPSTLGVGCSAVGCPERLGVVGGAKGNVGSEGW